MNKQSTIPAALAAALSNVYLPLLAPRGAGIQWVRKSALSGARSARRNRYTRPVPEAQQTQARVRRIYRQAEQGKITDGRLWEALDAISREAPDRRKGGKL